MTNFFQVSYETSGEVCTDINQCKQDLNMTCLKNYCQCSNLTFFYWNGAGCGMFNFLRKTFLSKINVFYF